MSHDFLITIAYELPMYTVPPQAPIRARLAQKALPYGSASLVVSGWLLQKLLDDLIHELAIGASLHLRHQGPH